MIHTIKISSAIAVHRDGIIFYGQTESEAMKASSKYRQQKVLNHVMNTRIELHNSKVRSGSRIDSGINVFIVGYNGYTEFWYSEVDPGIPYMKPTETNQTQNGYVDKTWEC